MYSTKTKVERYGRRRGILTRAAGRRAGRRAGSDSRDPRDPPAGLVCVVCARAGRFKLQASREELLFSGASRWDPGPPEPWAAPAGGGGRLKELGGRLALPLK